MKINVTVEVSGGKSCGKSWNDMCRFMLTRDHYNRSRIHCVLFNQNIELKGRYYMRCQKCLEAKKNEKHQD